jgi:hypothetical protein
MIILWIYKNKKRQEETESQDKNQSFAKHDEMMRKFRLEHPEFGVITDKDIVTGDGNLLAPVHQVKLAHHAQN